MDKVLLLTFKSRIQTCYASFTRTEQRVADYMLQNPKEVMEATSAQIAESAGVSPASVITGVRKSPMTQHTDILLLAEMEYEYDTSTVEARIAELTVIEILYSLLAAKMNRNAETFRKMNPLLEQWRHPSEPEEPSAE